MGKRMKDPYVECPYYCSEDPQHIYCKGVEEGNWIHMSWGSKMDKDRYKRDICKKCWEGCPVASLQK